MAVIGELATLVTANTKPFTRALSRAGTRARSFSRDLKRSMGRAVTGSLTQLGLLTSGLTTLGTVGFAVKLASDAEQAEVAFTTMLKSGEKARKLLAELQEFSKVTPFEPEEVRDAARGMIAFGFAGDEVLSVLQTLGDVAAGTQKPLGDFVDILGKARTAGVQMEEINRLAERGVPIFDELAKMTGRQGTELRKYISAGKVGYRDLLTALQAVTSEGGVFEGSMKSQSETLAGLFSTLKGEVTTILTELGTTLTQKLNLKQLVKDVTEELGTLADVALPKIATAVGTITSAVLELAQIAIKQPNNLRKGGTKTAGVFRWGAARSPVFAMARILERVTGQQNAIAEYYREFIRVADVEIKKREKREKQIDKENAAIIRSLEAIQRNTARAAAPDTIAKVTP